MSEDWMNSSYLLTVSSSSAGKTQMVEGIQNSWMYHLDLEDPFQDGSLTHMPGSLLRMAERLGSARTVCPCA